jgi:hypothetical protein
VRYIFYHKRVLNHAQRRVRHGKLDEARAALVRLTSKKNTSFDVEDTLTMMIYTNELEIQQTSGTALGVLICAELRLRALFGLSNKPVARP